MSVDTLRETFHINRISTSDLQDFLTAQTYRPEITQAKNHILSLKNCSLQAVCTKPIQQGKSPKYAEKGLKCIKPKNTNDMLVSIDDIDWIDSSTKDQIQKQKLAYGDIVITRSGSGTIGRASIYCYSEEAYTNDHLFVVRPDKADSHYICSFLNSFHGQRLLEAGVSGSTGQLNLSNEHIKSIPLFRPDDKVQKYIGDKVRQAEQLRAWAKSVQVKIKAYFDELMPDLDLKTNAYKTSIDSLENRLDAIFYLPRYVDLDSYFATKSNKVRSLADYLENNISGPAIPSNQFYSNGSGALVLQTKDIRENYIDQKTCAKITQENALDLKRFQVSASTLLMGMSGTIGRTALLFDEADSFIINQRVAALVLKDVKIAGYLCAYLNHSFGRLQLQRHSVGGVQANIGLSEITSAKILVEDRMYAEKISELFIESLIANKLATALTEAAKVLVESLIEGQLTEQQLIQAQQALEDGDNSLDQAILSKLSAEGYAIEGATPLFSDVDELYSLLEEAAQAEAEE
ncbi:TPA: restriction endonuclease subunit S [Escherichia albertii]|uniref:restriction endonuclease subunit S n=1 Tax=Escherichia albertii TaxID=208962 RepID=UPI0011F21819|nr:restriction endonuclease subunit S [Escherichia albertii]QTA28299.1 restriction endonuclease subunit S [Escherichia albertii]HCQ4574022.1 restriction endonuclease subunit S [Escherichia albertii]